MSFDAPEVLEIGSVSVFTSDHRSATIEELAARALDKIIYVGESVHPVIREQAEAFRHELFRVLVTYMREAVRSDRRDLARKHPELAPIFDL